MSLVQTVKVLGLGAIALGLGSEILGWILCRLRARPLNEVLFFPSETACVKHILIPHAQYRCSCSLPHGVETSFSRLLRHILSASSTLDLCVYAFSNMDLSRAVIAMHERGLTIRVLTDDQFTNMTGSQIGVLRRAGICVRVDRDAVHMHHKFALVDGRRLVTGSLNWTLTAVQSNKENILVTEEPDLVRPFVQEFQKLWDSSDPARHCAPPR